MTRHSVTPILIAALLISAACPTQAQAPQGKQQQEDSLQKDYKAELPRIPPKEPSEALKSFRLRPGFRIELVACEPLVKDPVAVDFDENGRMFVVEYPEYNQYGNKDFQGHGVVRLLEDTNQDGRFDKSTVYVDELFMPTAVACYDGGIIVGVTPDILYCKDTDGDGKADVRKVVLTGFGRDHAGESLLNSFRWGLDNRLHISTSGSGGEVRVVGDKESNLVSVRGRRVVLDPRTWRFELSSGGGQHGMSTDDWGHTFVCRNSNPIQMLMYDDRYLVRNPYLEAPSAAVSIAPDGKYTKLFRVSPVEPWRIVRTRLRAKEIVRGGVEGGGNPAGYFTGATGVTIYRGDSWPEEYRGNVLVGDVASNIVYRAKLEPNGVGFLANRADPGVEFLASSDIWFRPVQFANAPDGTLYVIDMYRELIEGAEFIPPLVLKHLGVSSGLDRGRIYRLVPEGFKQPESPKLGNASTAEIVSLLEHRNGWHRDTASRLLYERQDLEAVGRLKKLVAQSRMAQARMHALYALAGLGALDVAVLSGALDDPHPRVKEHAIRLSERFAAASPAIRTKLYKLTDDPNTRVRYQLAFSLSALRGDERNRALAKLAFRDGADQWIRLAVLSSLSDGAGEVFGLVSANKKFRSGPHGRTFLGKLASLIGAANRKNDVAAVCKTLERLPVEEKQLARTIIRELVAKVPRAARKQIEADGGKAGRILADVLQKAQKTAPDGRRNAAERVEAIRTLKLADFAVAHELYSELLGPRQPQKVQVAVLETLRNFPEPNVAALILEVWPGLSPEVRAPAAETLFSRTNWLTTFLDAVEKGRVSQGEVDPARIKLLEAHPDARIRQRAARLFAQANLPQRQDVVAAYQPALKRKADAIRGKMAFKKMCSACHKLEGVGVDVGAELAAIRNRRPEAMLLNILDPNREVDPKYVNYILATDAGQTITGMIATETANSITLRHPDGTSSTVLRMNIEELRSTGQSFMPEGLENQLDLQAMADLLAYLNSSE